MKRLFHKERNIDHFVESSIINNTDGTLWQSYLIFNKHFLEIRQVLRVIFFKMIKHYAVCQSVMYAESIAYAV